MYKKGMISPDAGRFTPESAGSAPLDSSQVTGRGGERYWKKLAIHLGIIAVGGALGWVIGGALADSVFVFGDIHPLRHLAFQFAGGTAGMLLGGMVAELETQKMPGTIHF